MVNMYGVAIDLAIKGFQASDALAVDFVFIQYQQRYLIGDAIKRPKLAIAHHRERVLIEQPNIRVVRRKDVFELI